ncbi:MlaE family ABC transporter permease [Desulfurobacterium atlanticum]|uniref:Phospholipid/cholesterol/gamma-HCH transport system permease protein n=1 Tax=Desulfurobacterium atlanticum TaxID=240169 RepID=A0A238Z995_9BACT|nr:ABC transporter permease [Desulfurobacterium atlanticum]SNR79284.1 phospholipid/cholesterol/gamma-HCH transport system permease protein [Desulfurobacterium atlanticum]
MWFMWIFEIIGSIVIGVFSFIGRWSILAGKALILAFKKPLRIKRYFNYLASIGADSFPVIAITSFFTGGVLALETYNAFHRFNAEYLIGAVVGLSMARELAPVLTALLVTARSGSAMAAEIGTMKVTEQIDALEMMAVNPIKYLITPRIYASVLALVFLTVLSDIVGYIGGYVISVKMFNVNKVLFLKYTESFMTMDDIYHGLIKAAFFGFILSVTSCLYGYYTRGGAKGVGEATTKAVVVSSMGILIFDYVITSLLRIFNL